VRYARSRSYRALLTLAPAVFLLASAAGLSYLVMLAEEKQRHMDMDRARNAAAAHAGQPATAHAHPPMPRK
jgi:hypothetical protein